MAGSGFKDKRKIATASGGGVAGERTLAAGDTAAGRGPASNAPGGENALATPKAAGPVQVPRAASTATRAAKIAAAKAASRSLPAGNVLGSSPSPRSSSPLSQSFKNPSTDLTLQEKERLIARHLVTQSRRSGSPSPARITRSSLVPRDVAEALAEELSPDNDAVIEQCETSGPMPAISIPGAQPAADADWDEGEIFSTSHKLVGGAFVRDIYKWHEKQAAAEATKRRSKSHTDLAALGVRMEAAAGSSAAPGAATRDRVDPSSGVTAGAINIPGGFRRHYVQRQAEAQGRKPLPVTKNFIDFLALYGHFAGDTFYDDEDADEMAEESDGLRLPYLEPGLPFPPRPTNEHTPLIRRQPSVVEGGHASAKKAVFLLLKSFIGTGVLFLPRSFYNGGMLFSIFVLMFISWLCLYAMLLLVQCRTVVKGSFGDIGGVLYGPRMRVLVLSSIAMSQVGFCCAYFIFVAHNMRDLVANITDCQVNFSNSFYIMLQLLLYIPMAMIRKIHKLGFLALVADVFILMGLAYLFYYDFLILSTVGAAPMRNFNGDSVSLFVGTAIFTFEGIGLVLPIAESMKDPSEFPRVLSGTMLFITVIFVSAGAFSYAAFGEAVETVVLLNLPAKDPFVHAIQFLYSLAIMFSVPLMLYPAVRIMEAAMWVRTGKASVAVKWQKNAFRAALCFFAALVSAAGSASLDRFVALTGAFACIPLSFIYPAMFHYKAVAKTPAARLKDIVLLVFGTVCMVFVAAQTIQNWIAGGDEPQVDRCA